MENRGLKTRAPISNAVDIRLLNALDELSKQTRIPKSKLLDEAIQLLLKQHNVKALEEPLT